jgi:HEAT repeat protein
LRVQSESAVKKFNRIAVPLILALTAGLVAVLPGPRWTVIGYLRREPFHEGRPISYWRGQLAANVDDIAQGSEPDETARAFKSFGSRGVPVLAGALKDGDAITRRRAATLLGKLGPQAAEAVPALVDALHDDDGAVRHAAILALDGIGPEAASAVPALNAVARGAGRNRIYAVRAIWHIEHQAGTVLPFLIAGLRDKEDDFCDQSLEVLGELRDDAREAIPALVAVCRDASFFTRERAHDLLRRLDPEGAATIRCWQVLTSEAGGFSIRLPGKAAAKHYSTVTRAGPVAETMYAVWWGGRSYSVAYHSGWPLDVPASATAEQRLDMVVRAPKERWRVTEQRSIQLAGKYPGRQVLLASPSRNPLLAYGAETVEVASERYYWVKGRLYTLYASGTDDEVRRFMDSFRLLDKK